MSFLMFYLPYSSDNRTISFSSDGLLRSVCCHISETTPKLSKPINLCLSPCFNLI